MAAKKEGILPPAEREQIAVQGLLSPRSVYRAYVDPSSVTRRTLQRVTKAALELGLPPPMVQQQQRSAA